MNLFRKMIYAIGEMWDYLIWDNPFSAWIARNASKRVKP